MYPYKKMFCVKMQCHYNNGSALGQQGQLHWYDPCGTKVVALSYLDIEQGPFTH